MWRGLLRYLMPRWKNCLFAVTVMGEKLKWNHAAAFLCLVAAVGFVFFDKLKAAV